MISDDYILGLVEGEGCFSIGISKVIDRKPRKTERRQKPRSTLPFRVVPNFRITMVQKDAQVLHEIREHLGVGATYTLKRQSPAHGQTTQYYTQSFADTLKVRDFFNGKQFHTTKGEDFELWCQALAIIEKKQHLTQEGLLEICRIRDRMNRRQNKTNRTKELVERILAQNPCHIQAHIIHNEEATETTPKGWFNKAQGKHKAILTP